MAQLEIKVRLTESDGTQVEGFLTRDEIQEWLQTGDTGLVEKVREQKQKRDLAAEKRRRIMMVEAPTEVERQQRIAEIEAEYE